MNDILGSAAFQEFLQKRATTYAKQKLLESGIDFKNIPKENIIMTSEEYGDKMSEENYAAVLSAIDEIYEQGKKL